MALHLKPLVFLLAISLLPLSTSSWVFQEEESEEAIIARLLESGKGSHDNAYIAVVNKPEYSLGDLITLMNLNGTERSRFPSWVQPDKANTFFHASVRDDTFCFINPARRGDEFKNYVRCVRNYTATVAAKGWLFGRLHFTNSAHPFFRVRDERILSNTENGRTDFTLDKPFNNTEEVMLIPLKLPEGTIQPTDPFDVDIQQRLVFFCSIKEKAVKIVSFDFNSASASVSYDDHVQGDCSDITVDEVLHKVYFFHGRFIRTFEYSFPTAKMTIETLVEIPYPFFKSLSCVVNMCTWVGGEKRHGEFVDELKKRWSWVGEDPQLLANGTTRAYIAKNGTTILQVQRIVDALYSLPRTDYCTGCKGFCFVRSPWSNGSEFPGRMNCYCPVNRGVSSHFDNASACIERKPKALDVVEIGVGVETVTGAACHHGWFVAALVSIVVASVAGAALLVYYFVFQTNKQQRADTEQLVHRLEWRGRSLSPDGLQVDDTLICKEQT